MKPKSFFLLLGDDYTAMIQRCVPRYTQMLQRTLTPKRVRAPWVQRLNKCGKARSVCGVRNPHRTSIVFLVYLQLIAVLLTLPALEFHLTYHLELKCR